MNIRSLFRIRPTKYFKSDLYVKNRCSRADAILVDMERNCLEDEYKVRSLNILRNSPYQLPLILVDPVNTNPNPWLAAIMKYSKIEAVAIRSRNEPTREDFDGIDPNIPDTDNVHTLIWNIREKRITHSIISYNMINDTDIARNSRLQNVVRGSLQNNIQPLAARVTRLNDMNSAVYEFQLLKEIGFSGILVKNPNLIDLCNKVFAK